MRSFLKRRGRPPHPDILTPSEWRVLEALRKGLTNTEIATELGLTVHGVKYHVSNMLGKLHLEGREQLAGWRPEQPRVDPGLWPLGALKAGLPVIGATAGIAAVTLGAFIAFDRTRAAPDARELAAAPGATPASVAAIHSTSQTATPSARDLTSSVPHEIDTGFGWSYVIDNVTATDPELAVTFHMAGQLDGLGSATASPPTNSIFFDAAATAGTPKVARFPIAGRSNIAVRFGPAVRARPLLTGATFERTSTGWTSESVQIDGVSYPAEVTIDGSETVVEIAAPVVLQGSSTGALESLTDNMGRNYVLAHGRSQSPPVESTWVFDGPVDPAASSLTFTLNGYANIEQGDWTITIPLN
jgi:DNA-binding CsgD family transcriptional regulator